MSEGQERDIVELLGFAISLIASFALLLRFRKLPCVSIHPFGSPVVPEVYTIVARL